MAANTPTHIIYLALPTKAKKPDGKSKAQWRRIGVVWKNKSLGSSITWDFTPVPTSPVAPHQIVVR
jgi:hypothetical protein